MSAAVPKSPLLRVRGLRKTFAGAGGSQVVAVDDVSFELERGRTLGLIGESGSGKSTAGRLVLRLLAADAGSVEFDGADVLALRPAEMRALRRRMQVVFQEPYGALNPRLKIASIIADPLVVHDRSLSRSERHRRVLETMEAVGLSPALADRHPGALSGGQQQRVGIARAIITRPDFVLLDEPTSSLDLSVRAQILELLGQLREQHGLTYLFISHDISTVEYFCDDILVMYRGRVVERGTVTQVLNTPGHAYTKALLSATLSTDPRVSRPLVTYDPDAPATDGAVTPEHKGAVT